MLLICKNYKNLRKLYIPDKYIVHPNMDKFNQLMSTNNVSLLNNLAIFVYMCFEVKKNNRI